MTRQRQLIYNIIQRADDHPTAEMIYARAKAEMPSIAFGTVYRNLKLMVDAGEILHIPVAGEPDRYDKTDYHAACSHGIRKRTHRKEDATARNEELWSVCEEDAD